MTERLSDKVELRVAKYVLKEAFSIQIKEENMNVRMHFLQLDGGATETDADELAVDNRFAFDSDDDVDEEGDLSSYDSPKEISATAMLEARAMHDVEANEFLKQRRKLEKSVDGDRVRERADSCR